MFGELGSALYQVERLPSRAIYSNSEHERFGEQAQADVDWLLDWLDGSATKERLPMTGRIKCQHVRLMCDWHHPKRLE
jgi:hypothetical protein